jgi:hypothetical protein
MSKINNDRQNFNLTITFKFYAMNALRNKVQLIGHVGNDPEIKNFEGGKN